MKKFLIMAVAFLMLSASNDSSLVYLKVSRVIDGDTFEGRLVESGNPGVNPWAYELTKVIVRINGIDAPERGQFYGDVATLHLYSLIGGKTSMADGLRRSIWIAKMSPKSCFVKVWRGISRNMTAIPAMLSWRMKPDGTVSGFDVMTGQWHLGDGAE